MSSLSAATLTLLPESVPVPGYISAEPQIGIAHIGVGNFHRSHQAMYIDRLLSEDPRQPWAICGIGVREQDRPLAQALHEQGGLYSLSLFHPGGAVDTRVIGSLREFLLVPDDPRAALDRLADPAIRIVSMTITESGYVEDPANGRVAAGDPGVRADVAGGLEAPTSAFGLIVAALRERRRAGIDPFTVLTCDNIQSNGSIARASTVETARLVDSELAEWIDASVGFPSTMVDRITPRPTAQQLEIVDAVLGVHDEAAVVAEPFEQWVLEDDFRTGRPELERFGAVFVDDIDAFESMKLRLLNGAHQVMAYTGLLAGHRFAHEAIADPRVRSALDRYWYELALPTVDLPSGVDGEQYIATLVERFGNPAIADTLERLATDACDRMAKFVLPVLLDARKKAPLPSVTGLILASWAVALDNTDSPVILESVTDDVRAAVAADADPDDLLSRVDWLAPLADDDTLRAEVAAMVRALRAEPSVALESS